MNHTEVIDLYCEVWSETDRHRRARLLASVWAAGATYTDPTVNALNSESLLAHIERIQLTRPGARVIRSTNVDEHHGCARFGFQAIGVDGAILREGTDIALMSADGQRIDRIIGFFGPLAATQKITPTGLLRDSLARSHMHVAALSASDVSRYRELMLYAYAVAPDAFTSTPEERAAEPESWWLRRVADPGGLSVAFGAFHDGNLVGTVTIEFAAKPKTRHKARLIGMFVHETCRGFGAGAALVHAALASARARTEVRLITLTVTEGNAPAISLYERCGFRAFGTEPMAIATPDGYKAKVHMWLPIAGSTAD